MTKALGLIETRGLVAAIVAADTMLKTANVTLAGKELLGAGLVTIKVLGDTASVKAAVEAASSAVAGVGELISAHVIPRPDDELISILPEIADDVPSAPKKKEEISSFKMEHKEKVHVGKAVKVEKTKLAASKRNETEEIKVSEELKRSGNLNIKEKPLVTLFDAENDTIIRLRKEALDNKEDKDTVPAVSKKVVQKPDKEPISIKSKSDLLDLNLEELDVHQLRRLARSTNGFPIHGRQISKANRKELIEYFKSLI